MIPRQLWQRTIYESSLQLVGSFVMLFSFSWIAVWLTSRIDVERMRRILDHLPRKWEELSPVSWDQVSTYTGRISMFYEHPVVLFVVIGWALSRGSDAVSGPLGRGTLEMILAQPISRMQWLVSQAVVTLVGVALLASAIWLGALAGVNTNTVEKRTTAQLTIPLLPLKIPLPIRGEVVRVPMSQEVNAWHLLPAAVNLAALGVFVAGLATFMSSWDRHRWRTIGLVGGLLLVQLILKVIVTFVPAASSLSWMTIFTVFEPQLFVATAHDPQLAWSLVIVGEQGDWLRIGPLGCNLVLVGLGAIGYILAAVIFSRRDLPAPL